MFSLFFQRYSKLLEYRVGKQQKMGVFNHLRISSPEPVARKKPAFGAGLSMDDVFLFSGEIFWRLLWLYLFPFGILFFRQDFLQFLFVLFPQLFQFLVSCRMGTFHVRMFTRSAELSLWPFERYSGLFRQGC